MAAQDDDASDTPPPPSDMTADQLRDFAHEIRNPLSAAHGFAQRLETEADGGLDAAEIAEYARIIHTATTQVLNICERVLTDAIEGERPVEMVPVDAREIGAEVIEMFGEAARKACLLYTSPSPRDS